MLLAVMLHTFSSGKVWPTVPVQLASARAPTGQHWHDRPLRGSRRATAPEQGDDAHAGSAVLQPARLLSESLPVGHDGHLPVQPSEPKRRLPLSGCMTAWIWT